MNDDYKENLAAQRDQNVSQIHAIYDTMEKQYNFICAGAIGLLLPLSIYLRLHPIPMTLKVILVLSGISLGISLLANTFTYTFGISARIYNITAIDYYYYLINLDNESVEVRDDLDKKSRRNAKYCERVTNLTIWSYRVGIFLLGSFIVGVLCIGIPVN